MLNTVEEEQHCYLKTNDAFKFKKNMEFKMVRIRIMMLLTLLQQC